VFPELTLGVGFSMFFVLHTERSAAVTSRGYFRTACFETPKIFYGVWKFGCISNKIPYSGIDSDVKPADGTRVLNQVSLSTYKRWKQYEECHMCCIRRVEFAINALQPEWILLSVAEREL
jgi:hypothetical protein